MRTFVGPILSLALTGILLSSCTRAVSDKSEVTIKLPEASAVSKVTAQSQMVGALSSTRWQLTAPSRSAQINCYAVMIRYEVGTTAQSCWTADRSNVFNNDEIHGGYPAGSTITIDILPGPDRRIMLVGFVTDDVSKCTTLPETGGAFSVANFSQPVILGIERKEIAPSSDDIDFSILSSIDPNNIFEDCLPKAFASQSLITAEVSGVPSGSTSSSTVTATVSGYNVDEYKYVITTAATCVGETYSSFLPLTTPISETLSDGTYRLCVIGRSSTLDVTQSLPTEKTWTIDTAAGIVSGISLYTSVGSNMYPTITVSGTSAGDSVEFFKGPTPCMNSLGSATATGTSLSFTPTVAMSEGSNVVTAIITDSLGNVGLCSSLASVSANYNLDTTGPDQIPSFLSQTYGTSLFYTPLYTWDATTDSNTGISHYEVKVDSGSWVNVGLNRYYFVAMSLSEGLHDFRIRAIDNVGNPSTERTTSFSVDTTLVWNQQAYAKAVNAGYNDYYGYAVAVDGDFMVVGAPNESSSQTGVTNGTSASESNDFYQSGAAYVYKRDANGQWVQVAYLKAATPVAGDHFGKAVAISRDTIVVGSPNETSTSKAIVNSMTGDSASGGTDQIGAVYVFKYDGTNWKQESYIKPPNSGSFYSWFGYSVAIDGDAVVVGAPLSHDSLTGIYTSATLLAPTTSGTTEYGGAYIFKRSGTDWSLDAYLKPPDVHPGMRFGDKVAISSGTVVVGSPNESSSENVIKPDGGYGAYDSAALYSGAAYVFSNATGDWKQQAYLKAGNSGTNDYFGSSVDIFDDRIVVGAKGEDSSYGGTRLGLATTITDDDSATGSGAVYIFKRTGTTWDTEYYLKAPYSTASLNFGTAVALWGTTLVVGAPNESSCTNLVVDTADNTTGCSYTGAAYTYQLNSNNDWIATSYFKASNNNSNATNNYSNYGEKVDISGSTVVIGSHEEASDSKGIINGTGSTTSGGSPTANSGAVYIYFP